jgi:UDP-N-acetylglucosamine 2-epimerase (non-hydrolysing)
VEAGLRSRDRTMPEELNRLVTDQLSDLLLTPSDDANTNLRHEGVDESKIRLVGNVMIDTLVQMLPAALKRLVAQNSGLVPGQYLLVTLHRPSNVDDPATLKEILAALETLARSREVLFPVHPRTRKRIAEIGLKIGERIRLIDPLGYLDFMSAMHDAALVITDSGGIQEETSYLGIPCLTARPNTERPVTITLGTNRLVPSTRSAIIQAAEESLSRPCRNPPKIPYWDGHAAERVAQELQRV